MLQVIRSLPPEASAVTAISQGLYYLDRCQPGQIVRVGHCLPALAQGHVESRSGATAATHGSYHLAELGVLVLAMAPQSLPFSCSAGGAPRVMSGLPAVGQAG